MISRVGTILTFGHQSRRTIGGGSDLTKNGASATSARPARISLDETNAAGAGSSFRDYAHPFSIIAAFHCSCVLRISSEERHT